nr:MAG TPA: hypothetical protein [Caudoviricetes sp.]
MLEHTFCICNCESLQISAADFYPSKNPPRFLCILPLSRFQILCYPRIKGLPCASSVRPSRTQRSPKLASRRCIRS